MHVHMFSAADESHDDIIISDEDKVDKKEMKTIVRVVTELSKT